MDGANTETVHGTTDSCPPLSASLFDNFTFSDESSNNEEEDDNGDSNNDNDLAISGNGLGEEDPLDNMDDEADP